MEMYNGCSVPQYTAYRQDIHLTHGYWMGSGRVKGYTHGWIACFVRMSKPSNSVHCSEIAHEVETGNIEPDFVLYNMKQVIAVGKKITFILIGSGLIALPILFLSIFGLSKGGWIATLPFSILGSIFIWSVLRLKPSFSEPVNQSRSQVYISSINILLHYESQNNEIVNCKTIPITKDSYIRYRINEERDIHTYKLFTGKARVNLLGDVNSINHKILDFAKKYDIEIIQ